MDYKDDEISAQAVATLIGGHFLTYVILNILD